MCRFGPWKIFAALKRFVNNPPAFSKSELRPEASIQTNFETGNRDRLNPSGSFENFADDTVVHSGLPGDLTQAPGTDSGAQVQGDLTHDFRSGVSANFGEPVGAGSAGRVAVGSSHDHTLCDVDSVDATCALEKFDVRSTSAGGFSYSQSEEEALYLAKKIDSYTPKMNPTHWAVIEEFVRAAITDAQPDRFTTAQPWLSNVAQLVMWCWKSECIELERELVFAPSTIFRFMESRTDLESGSRATIRSTLLRISERLIGPTEGVRDVRRYTNMQGTIPYTRAERISLRSFIQGEGTEYRRRNLRAIVALGAGAGLTPFELMLMQPEHVQDTDEALLVNVPGSRARTVPVFVEWEDLLRESVAEADKDMPFVLSSRGKFRYANAIPDFLYSCAGHGLRPHCQRLRSTWVVSHLNARTPINLLLEAAGVTEISTLGRYLKYVDPIDEKSKTDLLRLQVSK